MILKNIANHERVSLQNCESEPIHIPGAIQPHGFLIALRQAGLIIDFCSANSAEYCAAAPPELLGRTFGDCFGADEAGRLSDYLGTDAFANGIPLAMTLGSVTYSCMISIPQDGILLLEAEQFPDGYLNLPDLYRQTRKFVTLLGQSQSLAALCQSVAEETRSITGYDRVMIYRFDAAYNGEVIAEAKEERLEPFLNLHYPHTDIPPQARALYLRNLMRMIVDVHYEPVPILTIDDSPGKNLDLSHSILRSVSPIHIDYLKNMGVGATLTISLIHEGQLWGLISCHHYSPKNLPHYARLSALMHGHFLSSQIAVREQNEAFEASRENLRALDVLLALTATITESGLGVFGGRQELLDVANATGVAIRFGETLFCEGYTPPAEQVEALAAWRAAEGPDTFETESLTAAFGGLAEAHPAAAGMLYHSLSAGGAHYIIWFRKEEPEEVVWAGDPAKAITKDEGGLSPRKSFSAWRQLRLGQSMPWSEAARTAASTFTHALQKALSFVLLLAEEQRYKQLAERLQSANEELERINWISTHDLQEPLRKIQVFASRALESRAAQTADTQIINSIERMKAAGNRMQALITDIHEYARLLQADLQLEPTDLNGVLAEALQTIEPALREQNADVTSAELPVVNGEPFLLRQVFGHLLRNSITFRRSGMPLQIRVSAEAPAERLPMTLPSGAEAPAGRFHCISITDNGIGFDPAYAEDIFGLFKRLHTQAEFAGTGLGLALCRKIMLRHGGDITAEGKPGEGATLRLWFPAEEIKTLT